MDRMQWRDERRLWNEVRMDTIDARHYDEQWGSHINPSHRAMLERLLDLKHFANALHKNCHLYITVEVETEEELQIAYNAGKRLSLPLIYGEYAHHGGYHYYPTDEQVRSWLAETPFTLLDVIEGDGYRHYLASWMKGVMN